MLVLRVAVIDIDKPANKIAVEDFLVNWRLDGRDIIFVHQPVHGFAAQMGR